MATSKEEAAMADKQPVARNQSRSTREDEQNGSTREDEQNADPGTGQDGHEGDVASYEQELAAFLQERIKPGLNSGAIPLLARSIAKDIAQREPPRGASEDAEGDDEQSAGSEAAPDFEADMHELQAELGEDWILRFSVHGDDGWLTAEKVDGSQRVEAPTASVISEAVALINEGGGRPT
jgi:hypothetical protein